MCINISAMLINTELEFSLGFMESMRVLGALPIDGLIVGGEAHVPGTHRRWPRHPGQGRDPSDKRQVMHNA
ncbi:MAG: hypothetical protein FGM33_09130 [Candidatus Kapabacteria bacterium]|nr:hypothetical protein [Candidatus Kapabacteria bacterium]